MRKYTNTSMIMTFTSHYWQMRKNCDLDIFWYILYLCVYVCVCLHVYGCVCTYGCVCIFVCKNGLQEIWGKCTPMDSTEPTNPAIPVCIPTYTSSLRPFLYCIPSTYTLRERRVPSSLKEIPVVNFVHRVLSEGWTEEPFRVLDWPFFFF